MKARPFADSVCNANLAKYVSLGRTVDSGGVNVIPLRDGGTLSGVFFIPSSTINIGDKVPVVGVSAGLILRPENAVCHAENSARRCIDNRRRLTRTLTALGIAAASVFINGSPAHAESAALVVPTITVPVTLGPTANVEAWKDAARVTLGWDVQHQRATSELAQASIEQDAANVYVRFDVQQREPLLAQQHTNDAGDGTDDEVWVDLWPSGNRGFSYEFAANPNGTRWQYSSENSVYSPTWWSSGAIRPGGFTVTMKIPFAIMRGGTTWKAQFVRVVRSTGERQIWTHGAAQVNADDVTYAGTISGIAHAASHPQPRFAPYVLGGAGHESGYRTSRAGADFSLPITATSSVYGTIHPDFSNVEVDQQTISPTAFARSYNEVRPFFTQAFTDPFDCDVCPYLAQVYTPAIPTPREGYAAEGKEGLFSFGAFDAVGDGRNDDVSAAMYRSPDTHLRISAQRVSADLPGIVDTVDTTGIAYGDNSHFDTYFNYGIDRGTNVLDGRKAQRYDGGGYYFTNTFGAGASLRSFGQYYNPVDGYVQHTDIAGYAAFENKVWLFSKASELNSIQLWTFIDRYHAHGGALNQTDNDLGLDILTRNRIDVQANIGGSYLRLNSGVFTPVTQSGVQVTWHSGTANNPGNNGNHGSSSTPTSISYNSGRFGPGRVDSWVRSTSMVAGPRGTISLEADDTRDYVDAGTTNIQWLERLGYTRAFSPGTSLAIGVRRVIGTPPLIDGTSLPTFSSAWNLSFAFHRRLPHDELYFAYGDASQLQTVPQFIVKFIHYFGAEKGS